MSSANNASSNNAMSICIPRAFENITEARVVKVFEALNIFDIVRIDMVKRVNEKGEKFQRIFVHIKTWFETADALKARERLLSGKELKIVYDDPWFWKVSLNTWTPKPKAPPVAYDRKPKIRLEFEEEDTAQKNVAAAAQLLSSMTLEDRRPYAQRRVDPVYCEQDVKSGFRDRRDDRRPRNRSRSPDDRYRRDDRYRGDERRPRQEEHKVVIPPLRDYRDGCGGIIYPADKPVVVEKPVVEQVDVAQTASDPVTEVVEVVEKSLFKPRAIETKEQKEKRYRAKVLLAEHVMSR